MSKIQKRLCCCCWIERSLACTCVGHAFSSFFFLWLGHFHHKVKNKQKSINSWSTLLISELRRVKNHLKLKIKSSFSEYWPPLTDQEKCGDCCRRLSINICPAELTCLTELNNRRAVVIYSPKPNNSQPTATDPKNNQQFPVKVNNSSLSLPNTLWAQQIRIVDQMCHPHHNYTSYFK